MASRWRVWDMEFKDGILPNGEIVLSKDKYPEFKRTDQSNGPPVSIPGSLLDIIEMNSKNRMKEEVIIVSDSVSGAEYSYTRDGVLTLNTQDTSSTDSTDNITVSCTSLIGDGTGTNLNYIRHSSCPSLIFPQNRIPMEKQVAMPGVIREGKLGGIGRAQVLKERAIKATSIGHITEQRQKVVGRGRATSRKK